MFLIDLLEVQLAGPLTAATPPPLDWPLAEEILEGFNLRAGVTAGIVVHLELPPSPGPVGDLSEGAEHQEARRLRLHLILCLQLSRGQEVTPVPSTRTVPGVTSSLHGRPPVVRPEEAGVVSHREVDTEKDGKESHCDLPGSIFTTGARRVT